MITEIGHGWQQGQGPCFGMQPAHGSGPLTGISGFDGFGVGQPWQQKSGAMASPGSGSLRCLLLSGVATIDVPAAAPSFAVGPCSPPPLGGPVISESPQLPSIPEEQAALESTGAVAVPLSNVNVAGQSCPTAGLEAAAPADTQASLHAHRDSELRWILGAGSSGSSADSHYQQNVHQANC